MNSSLIRRLYVASCYVLAAFFLSACASPQQKLTSAALTGNEAELTTLLKSGVDVDAPALVSSIDCPGGGLLTPLQAAVCTGHAGTVKILLEHNASPNARGQVGKSALFFAVKGGYLDIANLLVKSGAKVDVKDSHGEPLLSVAAKLGKINMATLLLDSGAGINETDSQGRTALMGAANSAVAELLLLRKAELALVDHNGRTALHTAAADGRTNVVRLLLARGADSELQDHGGNTPLRLARAGKRAMTVKVLEDESRRLIRKQVALGDSAASGGDQDGALSIYTAAMLRAKNLGGELEGSIRIKIVRYVAGLTTPPVLPAAAREHFIRANYLIEKGRNATDVEKEMAAVVDAAPWWAEGYYNLALVQADRNRYVAAMETLKLFIQAASNSPKAQAAQDKIFELKIAKEEADAIAGMTGMWDGWHVRVEDSGQLTISAGKQIFNLTMKQGILEGSLQSKPYPGANNCTIPGQMHPVTGKISDDLRVITLTHNWSTYDTRYHCVDMFGLAANCCLLCTKVCDAVSIVSTSNQNVRISR